MTEQKHKVVSFPDRDEIEQQAALWVVRHSEGELDPADQRAFSRWLAASDLNQAAFERLTSLWDEAEILEELYDIADAVEREQPSRRRWLRYRGAIAAAVAFITCSIWLSLTSPENGADSGPRDYVSALGERRTVRLPDGTVAQLNTATAISFTQDDRLRTVRLLRGEAFFDVAHDAQKPFSVQSSAGSVEALGTAFATRLLSHDALEVTVSEGRVAVDPRRSSAGDAKVIGKSTDARAELSAGNSGLFSRGERKVTVESAAEINRKLAWREGVLVFAGEPLGDVVADVSRYTDISIEIADSELEALPIGGYFRVGETDALFEALELSFNVRVTHLPDGRIRLNPAEREKN
ncbi:MAG: FecR family protein [Pseudomonadota bacterium]